MPIPLILEGGKGVGVGGVPGGGGLVCFPLLPVSALTTYLPADLFTEPHCLTLHAPGKGGSLNPKGEGSLNRKEGSRGKHCSSAGCRVHRTGKESRLKQ